MEIEKIYNKIEKAIEGKKELIKHKKKMILHKGIEKIKERKQSRILDRIEDKIPSIPFME